MTEYNQLKDRLDKASKILSDRYELEIWVEYFNEVINGECCVYVRAKDSRRKPTLEEIEKAKLDLVTYTQKMQVLDVQFANI